MTHYGKRVVPNSDNISCSDVAERIRTPFCTLNWVCQLEAIFRGRTLPVLSTRYTDRIFCHPAPYVNRVQYTLATDDPSAFTRAHAINPTSSLLSSSWVMRFFGEPFVPPTSPISSSPIYQRFWSRALKPLSPKHFPPDWNYPRPSLLPVVSPCTPQTQ